MASDHPTDDERQTTPHRAPQVSPSFQEAVGSTFLVEAMMQLQKSVGGIEAKLDSVARTVDRHGADNAQLRSRFDRYTGMVIGGGAVLMAVLAILGGVLVWALDKGVARILEAILKT